MEKITPVELLKRLVENARIEWADVAERCSATVATARLAYSTTTPKC